MRDTERGASRTRSAGSASPVATSRPGPP